MPILCVSCRGPVTLLRDFGVAPMTNYFAAEPHENTRAHPLVFGQCATCGLPQLVNAAPPELLRPPQPVIYREPEGHLDRVVDEMGLLAVPIASSWIGGLTYKDHSTLERLRRRGFSHVTELDAVRDFGIEHPAAGLETIQERLTPDWARERSSRHGRFDVLIARHVLEHAHDIAGFLQATTHLLTDNGYLVIEVPDSTDPMRDGDYTMLWEEHVAYFTPATLAGALTRHGFAVEKTIVFPYVQENSIVVIARRSPGAAPAPIENEPFARQFAEQFPQVRAAWRQAIEAFQTSGRAVALFGAGHRAAMFVNLLHLADAIELVADESPDKIGRCLPGSSLRIADPSVLRERAIGVCLLAVSSEFESSVVARYRHIQANGGRFVSIFPRSEYSAAAMEPER